MWDKVLAGRVVVARVLCRFSRPMALPKAMNAAMKTQMKKKGARSHAGGEPSPRSSKGGEDRFWP